MILSELYFGHGTIDKNTAITEVKEIEDTIYTITHSDSYIDYEHSKEFLQKQPKDKLQYSAVVIKEIKQILIEYSTKDEQGKITTSKDLYMQLAEAVKNDNINEMQRIIGHTTRKYGNTLEELAQEIESKYPGYRLKGQALGAHTIYRNILIDKNYFSSTEKEVCEKLNIQS